MTDCRLNKILELSVSSKHTLDCGTDHGKLAVELINTGVADFVTASDINELPLKKAKDLVYKNNLTNKINVVLADGIFQFNNLGIDQIIIAGMGGELIRDIIDRADWVRSSSVRLILQPMSTAPALREYLYNNGFNILSESAVCESNKAYEVLVSVYDGVIRNYKFDDLEIGDFINQEKTSAVVSLLVKKRNGLSNRLIGAQKHNLKIANDIKEAINRINQFIGE